MLLHASEEDMPTEEQDISAAFAEIRRAKGFQAIAEAKGDLQTSLERSGLASSRSIVVALVTKLLRPGSSRSTDRIVYLLNKAWRRHSIELGIAIDPRVFAYLCVQYAPVRRRINLIFREISNGEDSTDAQLYAVIQQFLISDCYDSCPECLDHPNRFNSFGRPSRSLTVHWLDINVAEVSVDKNPVDWVDRVKQQLLSDARVCIVTSATHLPNVARHLQKLLAEELEARFLLLPVSITGVLRVGSNWKIMLGLKQASYGC